MKIYVLCIISGIQNYLRTTFKSNAYYIFQKKLQSIEGRFCDFYKSYILGEKEEENRIIANKKW